MRRPRALARVGAGKQDLGSAAFISLRFTHSRQEYAVSEVAGFSPRTTDEALALMDESLH